MANENRLIRPGDLIATLRDDPDINGKNFARVKRHIDNAPTVDAMEVVHGRWETVSSMLGYLCCSNCKDVYIWETWLGDGKWNYCPNCGADMRGANDGK